MMLFSSERSIPIFVRIIPGSIREVSAITMIIDIEGKKRFVIVTEKGFFSADNINKLKKRHLSRIRPLRKNSSLIPEPEHFMNVFLYDSEPVKYGEK